MDFHFSLQLTGDSALKLTAGHGGSSTLLFVTGKALFTIIFTVAQLCFMLIFATTKEENLQSQSVTLIWNK